MEQQPALEVVAEKSALIPLRRKRTRRSRKKSWLKQNCKTTSQAQRTSVPQLFLIKSENDVSERDREVPTHTSSGASLLGIPNGDTTVPRLIYWNAKKHRRRREKRQLQHKKTDFRRPHKKTRSRPHKKNDSRLESENDVTTRSGLALPEAQSPPDLIRSENLTNKVRVRDERIVSEVEGPFEACEVVVNQLGHRRVRRKRSRQRHSNRGMYERKISCLQEDGPPVLDESCNSTPPLEQFALCPIKIEVPSSPRRLTCRESFSPPVLHSPPTEPVTTEKNTFNDLYYGPHEADIPLISLNSSDSLLLSSYTDVVESKPPLLRVLPPPSMTRDIILPTNDMSSQIPPHLLDSSTLTSRGYPESVFSRLDSPPPEYHQTRLQFDRILPPKVYTPSSPSYSYGGLPQHSIHDNRLNHFDNHDTNNNSLHLSNGVIDRLGPPSYEAPTSKTSLLGDYHAFHNKLHPTLALESDQRDLYPYSDADTVNLGRNNFHNNILPKLTLESDERESHRYSDDTVTSGQSCMFAKSISDGLVKIEPGTSTTTIPNSPELYQSKPPVRLNVTKLLKRYAPKNYKSTSSVHLQSTSRTVTDGSRFLPAKSPPSNIRTNEKKSVDFADSAIHQPTSSTYDKRVVDFADSSIHQLTSSPHDKRVVDIADSATHSQHSISRRVTTSSLYTPSPPHSRNVTSSRHTLSPPHSRNVTSSRHTPSPSHSRNETSSRHTHSPSHSRNMNIAQRKDTGTTTITHKNVDYEQSIIEDSSWFPIPLSRKGLKVVAIDCEMVGCKKRSHVPPEQVFAGNFMHFRRGGSGAQLVKKSGVGGVLFKTRMKPQTLSKKQRKKLKTKELSIAARCSIVGYDGTILYDKYIDPSVGTDYEITDFRTPWSGITPSDMMEATPFRIAREEILDILKGCVVVGHHIWTDLHSLEVDSFPASHIRDTSVHPTLKARAGLPAGKQPGGLKKMTMALLGRKIQTSSRVGHCSVEDAMATMDLYKLVELDWEV